MSWGEGFCVIVDFSVLLFRQEKHLSPSPFMERGGGSEVVKPVSLCSKAGCLRRESVGDRDGAKQAKKAIEEKKASQIGQRGGGHSS